MNYDPRMAPPRSPEASAAGRWGAVTHIVPIRWLRLPLLRFSMKLGTKTEALIGRLKKMRVIAYARFTFLPSERNPRYLMFETNWSGPEQSYIPDLARLMQVQFWSIWGPTKGFPGPVPTPDMLSFVTAHDWGTDHYWSDYTDGATTQVVLSALELQPKFEQFVEQTSGLAPAVFAARWHRFTTRWQRLLQDV
jgi:hypothetical protein